MADAEISVIVELVDKISTNTKKIEGNLKSLQSTVQDSTNNLIAIGNAAASVDRIFSALQNQTLRLENASERLANAEDRLKDVTKNSKRAQEDYEEALKKVTEIKEDQVRRGTRGGRLLEEAEKELAKATERVTDSQDDATRATRSLTIAQNNLERAQNAVVGTYIQVGLQVVSLIGTLPQLIAYMQSAKIATDALAISKALLNAVMSPLGIATLAVAGGIYLARKNSDEAIPSVTNLTDKFIGLNDPLNNVANNFMFLNDELARTVTLSPGVKEAFEDLEQSARRVRDLQNIAGTGRGTQVQPPPTFKRTSAEIINTLPVDFTRGTSVNVSIGNIYGVNSKAISRDLSYQLNRSLNI